MRQKSTKMITCIGSPAEFIVYLTKYIYSAFLVKRVMHRPKIKFDHFDVIVVFFKYLNSFESKKKIAFNIAAIQLKINKFGVAIFKV